MGCGASSLDTASKGGDGSSSGVTKAPAPAPAPSSEEDVNVSRRPMDEGISRSAEARPAANAPAPAAEPTATPSEEESRDSAAAAAAAAAAASASASAAAPAPEPAAASPAETPAHGSEAAGEDKVIAPHVSGSAAEDVALDLEEAHHDPDKVVCGYLLKRGDRRAMGRKFQDRYIVLDGGVLSYYNRDTEYDRKKKPNKSRAIPLKHYAVVRGPDEGGKGDAALNFMLVPLLDAAGAKEAGIPLSNSGKPRVFDFRAAKQEDRDAWMRCFRKENCAGEAELRAWLSPEGFGKLKVPPGPDPVADVKTDKAEAEEAAAAAAAVAASGESAAAEPAAAPAAAEPAAEPAPAPAAVPPEEDAAAAEPEAPPEPAAEAEAGAAEAEAEAAEAEAVGTEAAEADQEAITAAAAAVAAAAATSAEAQESADDAAAAKEAEADSGPVAAEEAAAAAAEEAAAVEADAAAIEAGAEAASAAASEGEGDAGDDDEAEEEDAAAAASASSGDGSAVRKEGSLIKRAEKKPRWEERTLVLEGGKVTYKKGSKVRKSPRNPITVSEWRVAPVESLLEEPEVIKRVRVMKRLTPDQAKSGPKALEPDQAAVFLVLLPADGKGLPFYFEAGSAEERDAWAQALVDAGASA